MTAFVYIRWRLFTFRQFFAKNMHKYKQPKQWLQIFLTYAFLTAAMKSLNYYGYKPYIPLAWMIVSYLGFLVFLILYDYQKGEWKHWYVLQYKNKTREMQKLAEHNSDRA